MTKLSELKVGDKFRFAISVEQWGNVVVREYLGFINKSHAFTLQDIGVGCERNDLEVIPIREPQYKPYSDLTKLLGVGVKHIATGQRQLIVVLAENTIQCVVLDEDGDALQLDNNDLYQCYTHLDGTPCGELVN